MRDRGISRRAKETWHFLIWFFLFVYVPIIPAYYIISLKGIMGLIGLVYFTVSWLMIYITYIYIIYSILLIFYL